MTPNGVDPGPVNNPLTLLYKNCRLELQSLYPAPKIERDRQIRSLIKDGALLGTVARRCAGAKLLIFCVSAHRRLEDFNLKGEYSIAYTV